MTADFAGFAIGQRVRLRHDVDRFPHFIAAAGSTGTVVDVAGDMSIFAVRLDEPLAGAEEWDNEVHWYIENGDDEPERDLEPAEAGQ